MLAIAQRSLFHMQNERSKIRGWTHSGFIVFVLTALFMPSAGYSISATGALPKWMGWGARSSPEMQNLHRSRVAVRHFVPRQGNSVFLWLLFLCYGRRRKAISKKIRIIKKVGVKRSTEPLPPLLHLHPRLRSLQVPL